MVEAAGWPEVGGALERTIRFESFPAAIAFVNRVADLAEEVDHHPDIAISYRNVTFRLVTHSAGEITDNDRAVAAAIDALGQ